MSASVGIVGLSIYFPAGYQISREIADATGIPQDVIENGRIVLEGAGPELLNNAHVKAAFLGL